MTTLSSAVYNCLLERVASFQESQNSSAEVSCSVSPDKENDVYYRFDRGTLCEMLHHRCKHIGSSAHKNVISIELSIFCMQAINTKDKSDIPDYLQYRDRGFMYFLHNYKVFIPFLRNVNKVTNPSSFDEHGDNLIKVCLYNCHQIFCYLLTF